MKVSGIKKSALHLAMNLVIVAVYVWLIRDYLIMFSNSTHTFESISEVISSYLIAATLVIYTSYPFSGTKEHRTEFSLLILSVTATIVTIDKFIL